MKKERSKKGYRNIIKVLAVLLALSVGGNYHQHKKATAFIGNKYITEGSRKTLYTNTATINIISNAKADGTSYTDIHVKSIEGESMIINETPTAGQVYYKVISTREGGR